MKSFLIRFISGAVLVALAAVTVTSGGDVLFFTVLAVSLIGQFEIYKSIDIHLKLPGFVGYAACAGYFAVLRLADGSYVPMLAAAFLVVLLAAYVFSYPKYDSGHITMAFFGFFYVPFMLSYIYLTRLLENGFFLVWLVFICSWGCDTCAYAVGMLLGKHKLAPRLSPKKSVEGAVGGIVGAAALGAAYALILGKFTGYADANPLIYAGICAAGAVISQIGDLAASAIKRNHKIKDFGKLIPGHGGILDRFDSVIITAPIIYYLAFFTAA